MSHEESTIVTSATITDQEHSSSSNEDSIKESSKLLVKRKPKTEIDQKKELQKRQKSDKIH